MKLEIVDIFGFVYIFFLVFICYLSDVMFRNGFIVCKKKGVFCCIMYILDLGIFEIDFRFV